MEALGPTDPRQLGEYRLLRRLGAGGMGQVFLGRTTGGRTVAVKTVHGQFAADPEFRVRFRKEVAAARLVGGRWTAPVLDADTDGAHPWVATGYIAGPSLHAAVRESGPLPEQAARSLAVGLAEALEAVHRLGLVHRDVKPSNVLLALDGPRLIDFGIARALDAGTALTQSGATIGSPGFLSPEQAEGRTAGPAADVFSLGAVLAFAATGEAPFGSGVSAPVLLYRVLHEEPDLTRLRTAAPALAGLVAACLAKDPADRPTPGRLRERLTADDPAAAGRLERRDWLPPAIAGSLARLAVELLDLDAESATPPGTFGPPPAGTPPTAGATPPPAPAPAMPSVVPPPTPTAVPTAPSAVPPVPAAAPTNPVPQASPQAGSRGPARATTLLLSSVLAAAVAGTAVYVATLPSATGNAADGQASPSASLPAAPTAPSGTASNSPTSAAPTPADAIPTAFLGSWHGLLAVPQSPQGADFSITISQGGKGDPVARIHNNTGAGTAYCDSAAELLSAGTDRIVLRTKPMNILTGCVADPHEQVYTRNSDGSLHLVVGAYSGDLTTK